MGETRGENLGRRKEKAGGEDSSELSGKYANMK